MARCELGGPLLEFRTLQACGFQKFLQPPREEARLARLGAQLLRFLDGDGPDQDGLPAQVILLDLLDHGVELLALRAVDHVGEFVADQRAIGGDHDHFQVVNLLELRRLGLRRTGHAGQLLVHAEVVLEGDGGERLVLLLDLDAFLGLDGLVEPVRPAPARHQAPGELIHDDYFAVLHHVVAVALEERVGLERLIDVVDIVHVGGVVKVVETQQLFRLLNARLLDAGLAVLLVDIVVVAFLEGGNNLVDFVVLLRGLFGGPGNDQGSARLVDQDGVHLVHDGVMVRALHAVGEVELHVVAEVVETELVVGAVGDVGIVSLAALLVVEVVDDDAHAEAQQAVDGTHPGGVPVGQIIVHRDDVHALARE